MWKQRTTFSFYVNGITIELSETTQQKLRAPFSVGGHGTRESTFRDTLVELEMPPEVKEHVYFKADHPEMFMGFKIKDNHLDASTGSSYGREPTHLSVCASAPSREHVYAEPASAAAAAAAAAATRKKNHKALPPMRTIISRRVIFVEKRNINWFWETFWMRHNEEVPRITNQDLRLVETREYAWTNDENGEASKESGDYALMLLMCLAHGGDHVAVETLLQATPSLALGFHPRKKYTALHLAAETHHLEVVKMLVEVGGADVNAQTRTGLTPLMMALRGLREDLGDRRLCKAAHDAQSSNDAEWASSKNSVLEAKVEERWNAQLAVMKYLLQRGADPNTPTHRERWYSGHASKVYKGLCVSALGFTIRKFFYSGKKRRYLIAHRFTEVMSLLLSYIPDGTTYLFCSPPCSTFYGSQEEEEEEDSPPRSNNAKLDDHLFAPSSLRSPGEGNAAWYITPNPSPTKSLYPIFATTKRRLPLAAPRCSATEDRGRDDDEQQKHNTELDKTFQSSAWHYVLRGALANPNGDSFCCEGLIGGHFRGRAVGLQPGYFKNLVHSDVLLRHDTCCTCGHNAEGQEYTPSGLGVFHLLLALPQCGLDAAHRAHMDLLFDGNLDYHNDSYGQQSLIYPPDFSPTHFMPTSSKLVTALNEGHVEDSPRSFPARFGIDNTMGSRRIVADMLQRPALYNGFIL